MLAIILWVVLGIFLAVVAVGILFGAPYLPTRKIWVKDALDVAHVGPHDIVVDLGSGNGVVLQLALKRGARRAIGYEINPLLALWSRLKLRRFGRRALVRTRNFFHQNLPADTTVIYLFGVGRIMDRVSAYLQDQRPRLTTKAVKVVCFGFELPGQKPADTKGGMNLYVLK